MSLGNALPTRILDSVYQGDHLRVQLDGAAFDFVVKADRRDGDWTTDMPVTAVFPPEDCWVITP